jgi:hypothetical protein
MGKALLIIVLGAGLVMARHLYTSLQTEEATTRAQVSFQEETVAREIARSAFNNAMGVIRSYGENVDAGVQAVGGVAGQEGDLLGGEFRVRAEALSGHSVRVTATGFYGGGFNAEGEYEGGTVYTMHDTYRVPVLIARTWSRLDLEFLTAEAGYCSAVYYQEIIPGLPDDEQPAPRLLYAADNRDLRTLRLPTNVIVAPNTQMNFFIGVDQNCSTRPNIPRTDTCSWRQYLANHTFNPGNYDYVRGALDVDPRAMERTEENVWALVEQHPGERQRWRIGWEDLARSWDQPTSDDPRVSLQATKRLGYDGLGWRTTDARGYRALRDFGNQPDFEDQLIEIRLTPFVTAAEVQAERCRIATILNACGISTGGMCPSATPTEDSEPEPAPEPSTPPVSGGGTSAPPPPTSCPCPGSGPNNRKVAILHRPPGNEANEQTICVAVPGANTHLRQHNDYQICVGD